MFIKNKRTINLKLIKSLFKTMIAHLILTQHLTLSNTLSNLSQYTPQNQITAAE